MLAPPAVGIWLTVPREPTPVRGTGSEPLTGEPAIEGGLYTIGRQIADRPFHTPHLAVISFPPWKVTPSDIRDFCKPWRFDPTLVGPNAKDLEGSRLTRKEKMWYYVHDTCLKYHCRWFAITTADYWAFGMFASGWAGAFTSPPLPYFNQQPTVLQVLTLWTMSSLYENQRGNPFIMPIRSLELLTADSIDEDEILEAENYADLDDNDDQDDTRTEIDENDAAEIALAGAYSALNWGPLVTRWGSEIYGEFSSINVLQDQPGPAPADRLAFSQAVQKTSSMQARLARRFSPYPPLAKNQAHSSRVALSPIHETFDGGSGSAVAGPSKKKDEGNGRALDIATPLKAALPTISNALSRSASAPAAVLSLAFRERPGTNVSVRLTSTRTGLINNSLGTSLLGFDNPAEVPCQSRPSSLASKAPLTRENSFREHRPLVPMLPSSPVAGPNLGLSDNDEGATEMAE
ncbi:hypothetical protein FRB90_006641 [Tulasnella sp. 427]|nr:hypothetical protein FRB90_006641 [Tulasnella sp. 427]